MSRLVRVLLVECPALGVDDEGGRNLRRFAGVVEALAAVCPWIDPVRPGVCTLPVKGPVRYFGDEQAVLDQVEATVRRALGAAAGGDAPAPLPVPSPSPGSAGEVEEDAGAVRLGVGEGVFAAALAARVGVVVPAGETARFLSAWPVDVLGDPDLAGLLVRLGLPALGDFAALAAADVLARFGASGAHRHRVARAEEGELHGYRVPGMAGRLVAAVGRGLALGNHQAGFWGGASAADERAAEVLTALQRRLGTEAVTVPVPGGGRSPSERYRLVPWRPDGAVAEDATARALPARPAAARARADRADRAARAARAARADRAGHRPAPEKGERAEEEAPWPGRLPPPAPARVPGDPPPAELVGEDGVPLAVTGRGLLTGRPARVSVAGGPWTAVTGWSAPWPVEERWWSRSRRRAARLQVVTADERAYLLVIERGCWRVEAAYA